MQPMSWLGIDETKTNTIKAKSPDNQLITKTALMTFSCIHSTSPAYMHQLFGTIS